MAHSSRIARFSPLALAAAALSYFAAPLLPGETAEALYCPPGFESLPGCGGGGGNLQGWDDETIAGMSVYLYKPTTAPRLAGKRALMVNLHGCIQTRDALAAGANWKQTADEYGMVVAVPNAPGGGVIAGCWDYYDRNHSRTAPSRHDDNLLDLVQNLLNRPDLNIDPNQVYVTGLSSGAGESMVMGCLAPDVFAGIGLNAGPTVGTSSMQIGRVATDLATGRSVCNTFAGNSKAHFATQITSVIYGSNDGTVAPGYNPLNADIMASIYGASSKSAINMSALPGTNKSGSGTLYSDAKGPRVSLIQNSNLGHNWPGGNGAGGSYINTNAIDYAAYVTAFFFDNNRRVNREPGERDNMPPEVSITAPGNGATVKDTVTITANASDNVGVTKVEFYVNGQLVGTDTSAPYAHSWNTTSAANGDVTVTARAYDAVGNNSASSVTVKVSNAGGGNGLYCGTDSNSAHKAAGRAISYGSGAYSSYYGKGSFSYMGLGDAKSTTLKETKTGVFSVVTSCQ